MLKNDSHTEIVSIWPEINWIEDGSLREKVTNVWAVALERSSLTLNDLLTIPFTLLCGPDLKVTFMEHKRSVVHIAKAAGEKCNEFYHGELPVNMDTLIAGAILADIGKLFEYIRDEEGHVVPGPYGQLLRHPFSGVSIAERYEIPAPVLHIIATHASEGDLVKRTTEAHLVHHADFMTFLPFKDRLKL